MENKIFEQGDERWANSYLGNSRVKMGRNGCLTCAIAMSLNDFGLSVLPSDLIECPELYDMNGLIIWNVLQTWIQGYVPTCDVSVNRFPHRYDKWIKQYLTPSHGVLLEVKNRSHWLKADRPTLFGNDYVCRDSVTGKMCQAIRDWKNITGFAVITITQK